jgi:hypothetical protein
MDMADRIYPIKSTKGAVAESDSGASRPQDVALPVVPDSRYCACSGWLGNLATAPKIEIVLSI